MRPVRDAKCIVHIKIAKFGERLCKIPIVCFLAWLKADILEQRNVAALHVVNDFLRHIADRIPTENDGVMNQRIQILADRPKRILLYRFSFGPPKM